MAASSSSSPMEPTSASTTFPFAASLNPLTLRLDRTNYNFWRAQVLPSVRAHNLEGFLLGSIQPPAQFVDTAGSNGVVTRVINPDYVVWNRQDQYLVSWLLSSMSESMLGHVTRCVRASEIWFTLERLNVTQSRARVLHLRNMLQNLKKGDMSIEDYFVKMKNLADLLNVSGGQNFTDDELLLYILGGLGSEYESVVVLLTSRQGEVSLEEAQFMLQTQEMRIEHQVAQATLDFSGNPSANYANFKRGQPGGRGQGLNARTGQGNFNRGGGRGGRGRGGNKIICQICGRAGHVAAKCYHRFDITFQGNQGNSRSANFSGGPQYGNSSGQNSHHAYMNQFDNPSSSGDVDQNWYVDSGATNHVTSDLQNLSIQQDYKGKGKLTVGNGSQLNISHIGDIFLHSSSSQKPLILHNTLHVPDITKNLISISQFTKDNNVVIEFFSDCCLVKDKATKITLLEGVLKKGLYQLNLSKSKSKSRVQVQPSVSGYNPSCDNVSLITDKTISQPFMFGHSQSCNIVSLPTDKTVSQCIQSSAILSSSDKSSKTVSQCTKSNATLCSNNTFSTQSNDKSQCTKSNAILSSSNKCSTQSNDKSKSIDECDIWHQRLGHPSVKVLSQILSFVHGNTKSIKNLSFCSACKLGKMHQDQFPLSQTKTFEPFELVYSDVWGPSHVQSIEGYRYYLHFIDDFTRFTWIFPLKLKSECLKVFTQFNAFVERQFNLKIKCLQTDWGGEFRSLLPILSSLGIHFRHPCPFIHQQNGKAERKHQHIVETGLTLLAQANLPFKFWFDAFVSAVFLINRLPTATLGHKSPFECLFHNTPDYKFFKVFGCACYPFLRPYNAHKLQFRTSKCLFLGYSPSHKGYRCLHPSGRLYIAKTVHFNESEFPYQSLFHSPKSIDQSQIVNPIPVLIDDFFVQHNLSHLTSSLSPQSDQSHNTTISSPIINNTDHIITTPSTSHSPPYFITPSDHTSDTPHVARTPHSSEPLHPHNQPSNPLTPSHHMITRSKNGIFKPKQFPNMLLLCEHISEPTTVSEALSSPDWKKAMEAEFQALIRNDTWELVPYTDDMNVVTNKWVFRVKYNADGSVDRFKARLVAKGFQQLAGVDFLETFSPVVKSCTIRIVFSLAVSQGWDVQQIDINNAFLNGTLQEKIFMRQPEGFADASKPHHVCRLKKALYGLKQAPRAWFECLKTALLDWGFTNSVSDNSLFYCRLDNKLLIVLVYVDDILITGEDSSLIHKLIADLNSKFSLKTLGSVSYFLGIEAYRNATGLILTQRKYLQDLLTKTRMITAKSCSTPMCSSKKLFHDDSKPFEQPTMYKSTIGALQYLTLTRPDIAYSVNKLSQFLQSPTTNHWTACKRLLRYLKGTLDVGICFKPSSRLNLECFSDADWASSVDDRRSTSGCCIFLGGNLINWSSKKQHVVARSSTEAEYRALASATAELVWIQSVFKELGIQVESIPVLWCDNMGAISLAENPVFHARTKHIEIDVHFVREKVLSKEVDVRFVPSEEQVADLFTKALSVSSFDHFKDKLVLDKSKLSLRGDVKAIINS